MRSRSGRHPVVLPSSRFGRGCGLIITGSSAVVVSHDDQNNSALCLRVIDLESICDNVRAVPALGG
jgi:hypothetical protein